VNILDIVDSTGRAGPEVFEARGETKIRDPYTYMMLTILNVNICLRPLRPVGRLGLVAPPRRGFESWGTRISDAAGKKSPSLGRPGFGGFLGWG